MIEIGHEKWVKAFSGEKLPLHLIDVNECLLQKAAELVGHSFYKVFERGQVS